MLPEQLASHFLVTSLGIKPTGHFLTHVDILTSTNLLSEHLLTHYCSSISANVLLL